MRHRREGVEGQVFRGVEGQVFRGVKGQVFRGKEWREAGGSGSLGEGLKGLKEQVTFGKCQ